MCTAVSRSSWISAIVAFLGCLLITRLQDDEAGQDDDDDDDEEEEEEKEADFLII